MMWCFFWFISFSGYRFEACSFCLLFCFFLRKDSWSSQTYRSIKTSLHCRNMGSIKHSFLWNLIKFEFLLFYPSLDRCRMNRHGLVVVCVAMPGEGGSVGRAVEFTSTNPGAKFATRKVLSQIEDFLEVCNVSIQGHQITHARRESNNSNLQAFWRMSLLSQHCLGMV